MSATAATVRPSCNGCDAVDYVGELDEAGRCPECVPSVSSTYASLSPGLRDVLDALCEGRSPREIAARRGSAYNTVRQQICHLHERFGVTSTMKLVVLALTRDGVRR